MSLAMKKWMAMMMLMLLALPSLQATLSDISSYDYNWLSIDCGASKTEEDELTKITWQIDDQFIKSGEKYKLLISANTNLSWMNTLRYFTKKRVNCYELPLNARQKYLIRAGFLYGNYDNLRSPPTFDLEFDGNRWVTVNTSISDEPIYHEIIYFTEHDLTTVCLNQTQESQVPFISSLEAIRVDPEVYSLMNKGTALYLESRINYGANQSFPERFDRLAESYNRFWKPEQVPGYGNIFSDFEMDTASQAENYPPYSVLTSAIEAQKAESSIHLSVNFHEKRQVSSAYFVFYFAQVEIAPPNKTRKLIVYIDGEEKNVTSVFPLLDQVSVVSVYPVSVIGTAIVTLSPAEGTILPPILNAMEVFSAIHEVHSSNADGLLYLPSSYLLLIYFGIIVMFYVQ